MANLHGFVGQVDGLRAQVDLADLTLGTGLRGVRDDLVLELLADRVGPDDGAVLGELDAVVDELVGVQVVDRLGSISVTRPMRKIPSSPSMTAVGRVDLGGEERRR